jgi:hypothetical protein
LILGIFVTSCSVTRNIKGKKGENFNVVLSDNVLEGVKYQNITNNNFFIQKAEIEVVTENGKEKYLANIKFEKPDKYLISLRSKTGIEGARIYMSKDTILVNDRINKKMYFGTSYYLKKKYGFTQSFLPLIFGDIILNISCETGQEKCLDDKMYVKCIEEGIKLNYEIDCKRRKPISVIQMNNFGMDGIKITYGGFYNIENGFIPKIVEFKDSQYSTTIKIKIIKFEMPWNGSVKFIPGKGYELIELV